MKKTKTPVESRIEKLEHIQRRAEALKANHPEWADIIDAVIHPEDFQ